MIRKVAIAGLLLIAVSGLSTSALARTPKTDGIVKKITADIYALGLSEDLVSKPLTEAEWSRAYKLVGTIDHALQAALRDFSGVSAEDKDDDEVKMTAKRIFALEQFGKRLAQNVEKFQTDNKQQEERVRKFRDEARPFASTVGTFSSSSAIGNWTADSLKEAMAQLAALDELCRTKYAGIQSNERLSQKLGFDPAAACATASNRKELGVALVQRLVQRSISMWPKLMDTERTSLAKKDGFISIHEGPMAELMFDRERGKEQLLAQYQGHFDAVGGQAPKDLFAPIDTAVASLQAEMDRVAPTLSFPTAVFHDNTAEAGAKKTFANIAKDAKILKSAMLYKDWDVAKNALGVPTEQYRSGALLAQVNHSQWCQYREFTARKQYLGGGRYESSMTFSFGRARYQTCK